MIRYGGVSGSGREEVNMHAQLNHFDNFHLRSRFIRVECILHGTALLFDFD